MAFRLKRLILLQLKHALTCHRDILIFRFWRQELQFPMCIRALLTHSQKQSELAMNIGMLKDAKLDLSQTMSVLLWTEMQQRWMRQSITAETTTTIILDSR